MDIKSLNKELRNLVEEFTRTNSLKRKYDLQADIFILNVVRAKLFETIYKLDFSNELDLYEGRSDYKNYKSKMTSRINSDFINSVKEIKEFLFKLSINACKVFSDECFYESGIVIKPRRFKAKEVDEIMTGFFYDYGSQELETSKKLLDEERICYGYEDYFKAITYPVTSVQKGYVFHKGEIKTISDMELLVHELGHIIEFENIVFPQGRRFYLSTKMYQEVYSNFLTKVFREYLRRNRICVDEVAINENNSMSIYLNDFNLLADLLKRNDYGYGPGGYFIDVYPSKDGNAQKTYYNMPMHIMYVIGFVLSEYFYNYYIEDNVLAKKILHDFLSLRGIASNLDILESSKIDREFIESCELIREPIRKNIEAIGRIYRK